MFSPQPAELSLKVLQALVVLRMQPIKDLTNENCTYTTCRLVAASKKPTWYHRGSIQRCLSLPPKRNREKTAVTQRVAASQNRA